MTSSNVIRVATGATVLLSDGHHTFGPTNTFAGSGLVDLYAGFPSDLTVNGPLRGSALFQMDNDVLFTNCVLGGTLNWINGEMDGALTVGTNGVVVMNDSEDMLGSITNLGQIDITPEGVNPGGVGTFCSLSVGENYFQGSSGTLGLSVGGLATDQFDQLIVGGTASLKGELLVDLVNGFKPANHNTFQFLSCNSLNGTFSALAPNLIHWTSWTNFDAADGAVQFHDSSATNAPMRFYRAVVP